MLWNLSYLCIYLFIESSVSSTYSSTAAAKKVSFKLENFFRAFYVYLSADVLVFFGRNCVNVLAINAHLKNATVMLLQEYCT